MGTQSLALGGLKLAFGITIAMVSGRAYRLARRRSSCSAAVREALGFLLSAFRQRAYFPLSAESLSRLIAARNAISMSVILARLSAVTESAFTGEALSLESEPPAPGFFVRASGAPNHPLAPLSWFDDAPVIVPDLRCETGSAGTGNPAKNGNSV